jgi:hypothetical protein
VRTDDAREVADEPMLELYRVIRGERAVEDDFRSYAALNTPPKFPLTPLTQQEYEGVSTFDTREAASKIANQKRCEMLAVLYVVEDGSVAIAQKLHPKNRHHFTLWAEPVVLLNLVSYVTRAYPEA